MESADLIDAYKSLRAKRESREKEEA